MGSVMWMALRGCISLIAFMIVTAASCISGMVLISFVGDLFPPQVGSPGTDPRGREITGAVDVGLGPFICILLGAIAGWLAWLWTDRRNWSLDLAVASPLFLIFAIISAANYITLDVVFSRDAQAVLNILLAATGVTVALLLQKNLTASTSTLIYVLGASLLAFCIYAFVAIPLWYSLSFLSWKMGAGELTSLDAAAKAISAAASVLSVVGLLWKDGRLSRTPGSEAGSKES